MDPVDDVVIGRQRLAEDGDDARLGLAGQLHLDGGAPLSAPVVLGDDDPVGEVEGPAALALAEFPFADPAEPSISDPRSLGEPRLVQNGRTAQTGYRAGADDASGGLARCRQSVTSSRMGFGWPGSERSSGSPTR